jgi:hypothetical protein
MDRRRRRRRRRQQETTVKFELQSVQHYQILYETFTAYFKMAALLNVYYFIQFNMPGYS